MIPPLFALLRPDEENRLSLRSEEGHLAHIFVLEEDMIRVMVLPFGKLRNPHSWSICPGGEDLPAEGRRRFDLGGFALPSFKLEQTDGMIVVTTNQLRLTVALAGLHCRWENFIAGAWRAAASDRPTQAYNFGWWDQRIYHYLARERDEMYFGLGERAGSSNRAGQSYKMVNIDAMGYSARTSDPLYKHFPFYFSWKPASGTPLGIFYDTLADCQFDMGKEMDNYHGLYRYFAAESGDLDYTVIGGATPAHIVRRFTWLTGRPAFMPKWSLGYSGSTMSYTDAPDAQVQMNRFLDLCAKHDMLCTSFHLSSGYTSIGDKRYVFNWNRDKFPSPEAFARHFRDHGVRLCANIKPCLLQSHPLFEAAAKDRLLVQNPDGSPNLVQFWDETGAYLDFTNPATRHWWQMRIRQSLLALGITATWNDNNEFEIWSDQARIHGFDAVAPARDAKPLQTLLMLQASRHAQRDYAPGERPFLVSRAGAVGMQRYAQTWSGDNYTSWETLKYNIRMGLGLAMSGVSNTGHDIGGFAGPAPDAELLLRWVQFGIFLPRFSIHSWNDDRSVNEPWMFPAITPVISALLKLRARLAPYLYHLSWLSHREFEPMIRPTYYDFPDDPNSFLENDEMMLGPDLLVAAVVEPGQSQRKVTLPADAGWYDFWNGGYFRGGKTITLPAALDARPPLLARAGSAIPLNLAEQHFNRPADRRGFALFPPQGKGEASGACFEDDGSSEAYRMSDCFVWRLTARCDPGSIHLSISIDGKASPPDSHLVILLPPAERRKVVVGEGQSLTEDKIETWRRLTIAVP